MSLEVLMGRYKIVVLGGDGIGESFNLSLHHCRWHTRGGAHADDQDPR